MVGGGAAGVYAAIQAKKLAPFLNVIVVEKGRLLSKVVTRLPLIYAVPVPHCLPL